ncbi:MAG: right-handed parallel beta-helix repeat-containing protein [Promethearchaeota archaeon]
MFSRINYFKLKNKILLILLISLVISVQKDVSVEKSTTATDMSNETLRKYLSNSNQPSLSGFTSESNYTNRGRIFIDGNLDFTPQNGVRSGDGTEQNPFLISNWNIIAEDGPGSNFITIRNTNAYYILENITISNNYDITALDIQYSNNGLFRNIKISNCERAVVFWQSSNIRFEYCTVFNINSEGIGINKGSSNILIKECNIYSNKNWGIRVYDAENCTIFGNNISENALSGIAVEISHEIYILLNIIENNDEFGIISFSSYNLEIIGNRIQNNRFDGIGHNSDVYGIECHDIIIKDNIFSGNSYPITGNVINLTTSHNSFDGVYSDGRGPNSDSDDTSNDNSNDDKTVEENPFEDLNNFIPGYSSFFFVCCVLTLTYFFFMKRVLQKKAL